MSKFGTFLGISGFVVGVPMLLGFYALGQATKPAPASVDYAAAARYRCGQEVKRRLKDPAGQLLGKVSWPVAQDGAGHYTVTAAARARNSFGAELKARFTCRYHLSGDHLDLIAFKEG